MKHATSPLEIPERRGPRFRVIISTLLIAVSIGVTYVACEGVALGKIMFPHRYSSGFYVYRSSAPVLFWTCVAFYFAGGIRITYLCIREITFARHLTRRSSQPLTGETISQ